MQDDIIFHLVSSSDWKAHQNAGFYSPVSLEEEGYIHCSNGRQVQKVANRFYKGTKGLILLVIDLARLEADLKLEIPEGEDEPYPHVYGPVNIDSIIDKIMLEPEEDGSFYIKFSSEE